jgi:adenosylhomocysteine nucleosidase
MPSVLILGALPQELAACERRLVAGRWNGVEVHLALTGVGKPAAAAAAQRMIDRHRPDAIVFTGVAGALDPARRIGEIGIGVAAIDADLDIRAWLPGTRRGEHPFTGLRVLRSDPVLAAAALATPVAGLFPAYIASGSAFLDTAGKDRFRREVLPDLAAEIDGAPRLPDLIEMEGSAVLQTALAEGVPALAIRAVSDTAGGDAVADFNAFVADAIASYLPVVERVLAAITTRR